jgi:hypothetical protein
LAQSADNGRWIEGGWAEVSWLGDVRYVYSFDSAELIWHFHTQYPLTGDRDYVFRVVLNGFSETWAEILWDGQWQLLETAPVSCLSFPAINPRCRIEEFVEVHNDETYPDFYAPNGIGVWNTKLLADPGWVFWDDTLYPSRERGDSPYLACWINRDWNYRAVRGTCS